MPWIRVELSAGRTEAQKAKAAEAITKALVDHCNCKPETVSIVFNDVANENWAFGGVLLSKR
ncbi:MAG: tautomerase family protein [Alphaproteobacteria bacterium]|nr:tautomerase family protein [Alphaproteobacteria bacterium]